MAEERRELAYLGLEKLLAAIEDAIESTFDEYALGKIDNYNMKAILDKYSELLTLLKDRLISAKYPEEYKERVEENVRSLDDFIRNELRIQIETSEKDYEEELGYEELESDFEIEDLE